LLLLLLFIDEDSESTAKIVDMEGLGWHQFYSKAFSYFKMLAALSQVHHHHHLLLLLLLLLIVSIFIFIFFFFFPPHNQDHYPEMLGGFYVINAPWIFNAVCANWLSSSEVQNSVE